jgi:hypothetical protein
MVVYQIFDKLWAYKLPNAAAGPDSRYPDLLTIFGIYQQKHKLRQFHVQEIPGTGLGTRSETRNVQSPSDKVMTYRNKYLNK